MTDGIPRGVCERFRGCRTIRLEDRPVDIRAAARECDLAVLNAGHGATAAMLLAGKPVLLVPIHLEQGLLARAALGNTGAGLEASHKDGEDVRAKLAEMLASDRYGAAAGAFAAKHADFDPKRQREAMLDRAEELLASDAEAAPLAAASKTSTAG